MVSVNFKFDILQEVEHKKLPGVKGYIETLGLHQNGEKIYSVMTTEKHTSQWYAEALLQPVPAKEAGE